MTSTSTVLRRFGASTLAVALTGALLVTASSTGLAQEPSPNFTDLDETVHADAIRLVAEDGITRGYADGTFRPRDDVRRDQMATFLTEALRLDPAPADFPDVPSESVHAGAIGAIAEAGITQGFADGTYRPLGFVTRGQLATFLAEGLDLDPGTSTFTDVPSDYVHAPAIAALADADPPITAGFPDGTFRPNELVKRDQMAAFLARGIPLPREPEVPACPGSTGVSGASTTVPEAAAASEASVPRSAAEMTVDRESEDLMELELGDVLAEASGETMAPEAAAALSPEPGEPGAIGAPMNLGAAMPGVSFPLTSVLRTSAGDLEVHTQDLPTSRGARIDAAGEVTATTTVPAGRRTWATAQVGNDVYVGQWGVAAGQPNVFRYSTTAAGARTATAVATVPAGNEFWTLAADPQGRLWAGTRAHNDTNLRAQLELDSGLTDGRHVVHRIDPATGRVTPVVLCLPSPAASRAGVRPDIKQLAAVGSTLYVGTGQLTGGARLYAVEPGNRTDIPAGEVRDLTPSNVRSATGIFAMQANDTHVAFGTQTTDGSVARLVVIDRATEQVRVNVPLTGETRVDAVHLRGDRVVATGFSGRIHDATIPASGIRQVATAHDPPVAGQFHRFVEIRTDGSLRGVTQQGVVWTRATDGEIGLDLIDTGTPLDPGLPHSLHVGAVDVVVGASSAAALRSLDEPQVEPRTVAISGEAKAATSDPEGNSYLATYPNAGLWRVDAGGDEATQVRSWTGTFLRPAAADFDARTGRVNVIARDDNAAQSLSRTAPQANFQFRPSRLFSMDPTPSEAVASGVALGRGGSHTSAVSQATAGAQPIEASALLSGVSDAGSEAFVGDTLGGVQRVNAIGGQRQWYAPARAADADRPVVGISLVEDRLIVVHSGWLNQRAGDGGGILPGSIRTAIRELDPVTGAELDYHEVSSPDRMFAVPDAFTSGSVTVMASRSVNRYYDRATDDYWSRSHTYNYSFGGPYVGLDRAGCALYHFEGEQQRPPDSFSNLVRTPIELGDCLPEPEPEDPDEGDDPGDGDDPGNGDDGGGEDG